MTLSAKTSKTTASTKSKTSSKTATSASKTTPKKKTATTSTKKSTAGAKKKTASETSATTKRTTASKTQSKSTSAPKTTKTTSGNVKKKPKLEEQQKIISKFIDKDPSITAHATTKTVTKEQPDLSEASTQFGEDLISENLAQILVSQNKKDKAIDIYKKLIWKFPQKKSYFAALIEDLKK